MGDLSDAEIAMRWARAMVRFIAGGEPHSAAGKDVT